MIGSRWSTVALGDVLSLSLAPERVEPGRSYPALGVYGFGRGVITDKLPVRGSDIAAPVLFKVKAGQFIYSKLKAFEGAFAVVPDEADGRFVTNEFPTFDCHAERLDVGYLAWLFRLPATWTKLSEESTGIGARRERVHPEQVLRFRCILPPLAIQRSIATCLDNVAERIAKRAAAAKKVEAELGSLLQAAFRKLAGHRRVRLSEVMKLRPTDTAVMPDEIYQFAGVYSFGRGVFRSVAKRGSETAYQRLTRLRQGNFVYPKLMAWEGALGIVPPICDGCFVSPEFPVFEIDQDAVLPELLELHFRDRANWPKSTGTNVRRKRVHPEEFLRLEMPLPPLKQQEALAEACRKAAVALTAQRDAAEELDKLLPALLHEAFGEGTAARPRAAA